MASTGATSFDKGTTKSLRDIAKLALCATYRMPLGTAIGRVRQTTKLSLNSIEDPPRNKFGDASGSGSV
jgi:hypothetical protein